MSDAQYRVRDIAFLPDDVEQFVGGLRTNRANPFALFRMPDGRYKLSEGGIIDAQRRTGRPYGSQQFEGLTLDQLVGTLRRQVATRPWHPDVMERGRIRFFAANPQLLAVASPAAASVQHAHYLDQAPKPFADTSGSAPAAQADAPSGGGEASNVPVALGIAAGAAALLWWLS